MEINPTRIEYIDDVVRVYIDDERYIELAAEDLEDMLAKVLG